MFFSMPYIKALSITKKHLHNKENEPHNGPHASHASASSPTASPSNLHKPTPCLKKGCSMQWVAILKNLTGGFAKEEAKTKPKRSKGTHSYWVWGLWWPHHPLYRIQWTYYCWHRPCERRQSNGNAWWWHPSQDWERDKKCLVVLVRR